MFFFGRRLSAEQAYRIRKGLEPARAELVEIPHRIYQTSEIGHKESGTHTTPAATKVA
jgi:hypothetical protein